MTNITDFFGGGGSITSINGQTGDIYLPLAIGISQVVPLDHAYVGNTLLHSTTATDFRFRIFSSLGINTSGVRIYMRLTNGTLIQGAVTADLDNNCLTVSFTSASISSVVDGLGFTFIVYDKYNLSGSSSTTMYIKSYFAVSNLTAVSANTQWYRPVANEATVEFSVRISAVIPQDVVETGLYVKGSVVGDVTRTIKTVSSDNSYTYVNFTVPRTAINGGASTTTLTVGFSVIGTSSPSQATLTGLGAIGLSGATLNVGYAAQTGFPGDNSSTSSSTAYFSCNNPFTGEFLRASIIYYGQSESCCDPYTIQFPAGTTLYSGRGSLSTQSTTYTPTGTFSNLRGYITYSTDSSVNGGYGGYIRVTWTTYA